MLKNFPHYVRKIRILKELIAYNLRLLSGYIYLIAPNVQITFRSSYAEIQFYMLIR